MSLYGGRSVYENSFSQIKVGVTQIHSNTTYLLSWFSTFLLYCRLQWSLNVRKLLHWLNDVRLQLVCAFLMDEQVSLLSTRYRMQSAQHFGICRIKSSNLLIFLIWFLRGWKPEGGRV